MVVISGSNSRRYAQASVYRRSGRAIAAITAAALTLSVAWSARADYPIVAAPPAPVTVETDAAGGPLNAADAARYRLIFDHQEAGKMAAADAIIATLDDNVLMGQVLAQRYLHPTAYRSRYRELKAWLKAYRALPPAKRIWRLAIKRKPKGVRRPARYQRKPESLGAPLPPPKGYRSSKRLSRSLDKRRRHLIRKIRRNLRRTYLTPTARLLASRDAVRLLDRRETDAARADLGAAWYYYGRNKTALQWAVPAAERSGAHLPIAHWTVGLAAWRLKDFALAKDHFESLARSSAASPWNLAAGAFWAARAHSELGQAAEVRRWLQQGAAYPQTFYGILSQHVLGIPMDLAFEPETLTGSHVAELLRFDEGRRALALLQIGQYRLAEQELLHFEHWKSHGTTRAMLAVANHASLAGLSHRLAERHIATGSGGIDPALINAAFFPIPPWRPTRGYRVDRAFLFALMRQESSFDPEAKSHEGARGLMQLMPRTARSLTRKHHFRGRRNRQLFDPGLNLDLGQRYVLRLMNNRHVKNDIFRLAVAYNGGPGNLRKWQRRIKNKKDPLLFIESLPTRETRIFIERVLTNLWIYRHRLGQDQPSLTAVANGGWPIYRHQDPDGTPISARKAIANGRRK